ncbi:hypothetical protein Q5X75_14235 [Acinetobacter baumannii]|uniref:hypothetical protein n=1 Tax=Acinetobacter baumannii TaxID=470 RepID=UPI0006821EEA|nr:hypothetical protein [Acinetobacter baumannii]EHU1704821.1 hypothetical protein [Acinetobacter baumannii]EKX9890804.1 hypothetical protein [Acinetobacter baumannii]ELA9137040.1 hypothetical protein [Acinetobacter baumannii]ELW9270662.1 hypothetical protein [Acinetobacter baumannii]MDC4610348.1 hypothetical protein [Acinetobacter baumannii]
MDISLNYFNKVYLPIIKENYKVTFTSFKEGEVLGFGDLERVEVEDSKILGGIEFWSSGWLNIHLINLENNEEILNSLVAPDNYMNKIELLEFFFRKLMELKA